MARTSRKRVTRLDRQEASRRAASFDLGPVARGVVIVAAIAVVLYVASVLTPSSEVFGGPLQAGVAGEASFTSIRKTGGGEISLVIPVAWNTGTSSALLEGLAPIVTDGLRVKRSGVAPPGGVALESQRGFPPEGVALLPVNGFTAAPGSGELDGFQIVVGLVGEGTVSGFVLHYSVGGTAYTAVLPDGAMLCADSCVGRAEAEDAQRAFIAGLGAYVKAADR